MVLAACSEEQRLTVTATAFNSTPAQTDSRPFETAGATGCGRAVESLQSRVT
jgi:hypothetical protein